MTVYTNPFVCLSDASAVALGYFDGVHMGHRRVITGMCEYAKQNRLNSVIWTFDSSPKNIYGLQKVPEITTASQKKMLFEQLGADTLVTFPFYKNISGLSCEDFVRIILKDGLKAKKVFCGFNYTFGAGGKGNSELLRELCECHGLSAEIIAPVSYGGELVSSSRIRTLIENGDVQSAAVLLGNPYSFENTVICGKRLGRTLGFPTINQALPENTVTPKKGVYLSRVSFEGNMFYGITNIGTKPTVGKNALGAETNIFGFDGDLYGKRVTTELLRFLREERKFETVDMLKAQVIKDIETAEKIIGTE